MSSRPIFLLRMFLGIFVPFLLEIFILVIYTGLKNGTFQYSFLLTSIFFVIPSIFLYLVAPELIFSIGRVRTYVRKNLVNNLDKLFLQARPLLGFESSAYIIDMKINVSKKEHTLLRNKITQNLIPKLLKETKTLYKQNYIDRNHNTRYERLLTYHETLFLFSFVSVILLALDLILILILSKTSIVLDFIVIDQISNPVNVAIFSSLFAFLLIFSSLLLLSSSTAICQLIPKVLPIIFYEPEEERKKRLLQLQAVAQFPIGNIISRKNYREVSKAIDEAKKKLLLPPLIETLLWYYREQLARTTAWQLYKDVLEEMDIREETKKSIEKQFVREPFAMLLKSEILSKEEERAIKADLDYISERVQNWSTIRTEDQTLAFLLAYRTLETIFRRIMDSILPELNGDELNFLNLIDQLAEHNLLTENEVVLLHNVRSKRNLLFHEPGKQIEIGQKTMEELLKLINLVLERVKKKINI